MTTKRRTAAPVSRASRAPKDRGRKRSSGTNVSYGDGVSQFFNRLDRVNILMWGFLAIAILIMVRLFMVQVLEHAFYTDLATDQHALVKSLLPERGEIYAKDQFSDSGLAVIATNRTLHHVYADPRQITDPQKTADAIVPILDLDPQMVLERLSKQGDVYEPLKHQVSDQEIQALTELVEQQGIKGIHWVAEEARFYPEGPLNAGITGFLGIKDDKNIGQYGLEGYYNDQLSGTKGSIRKELDAFGRFIAVGGKSITEAQDGDKIILTIDKNIQYKACTLLSQAVEKHKGKRGSLIVVDPKTGSILAMCSAPQYDPNQYSQVEDASVYMNRAISAYEPGSVLKPIAMAAAINEGKVTPYSTYTDTGVVNLAGHQIHNSDLKAHGVVDMTTVLEFSLNTGAIYAVQQVGNEKWYQYLQKFGFGKNTDITLNGEHAGNIEPVYDEGRYPDIATATSSYGQGITTTPLQLVQAFSAFANQGTIMKTHIVDRIVKSNGYQDVVKPEVLSQPISAETANTLAAMLVRVVDEGHATKAAIDGYFVAGKTGTAQIVDETTGRYHAYRHNDTFVGFVSVTDPKAVIVINIDDPEEVAWADSSAGPVFSELGQYIVNYMHIQPDRTEQKP